jgi:hypothetical protein
LHRFSTAGMTDFIGVLAGGRGGPCADWHGMQAAAYH